jgi:hypothetical protein
VADDEVEIQRMLARYEGCHQTVRGFFHGWLGTRLGARRDLRVVRGRQGVRRAGPDGDAHVHGRVTARPIAVGALGFGTRRGPDVNPNRA